MNDERWDNLTKMIAEKFEMEDEYVEEIPSDEGGGKIDIVICSGPMGRIKLERYIKPLILNKKTFYSKRGGGDTAVEYVYSENETTQSLKVYKWDEFNEEWQEIKASDVEQIIV